MDPLSSDRYDQALTPLKKGEYERAVSEFTEVIRLDPSDPKGYLGRALAYRSLGEEGNAVADECAAKELEQTTWQRLVKQAYARQEGDLRHADAAEFYERIDPLQRKAVLLRDFDYQVCEGGIPHWILNARDGWISEVMDLVQKIGTEAAKEVLTILQEVSPLADSESEDDLFRLDELTNRYLLPDPKGDFGCASEAFVSINESLRERFVNDVETWLQKQVRAQS